MIKVLDHGIIGHEGKLPMERLTGLCLKNVLGIRIFNR